MGSWSFNVEVLSAWFLEWLTSSIMGFLFTWSWGSSGVFGEVILRSNSRSGQADRFGVRFVHFPQAVMKWRAVNIFWRLRPAMEFQFCLNCSSSMVVVLLGVLSRRFDQQIDKSKAVLLTVKLARDKDHRTSYIGNWFSAIVSVLVHNFWTLFI